MAKKSIEYQELLDIVKNMKSNDELILFFLRACESKNLKVCQLCLDAGFDINVIAGMNHKTLFQYFVESDKFSTEVADWLIEHGADMNIYNAFTSLAHACYHGNYEMAKYFIDKGMKIMQIKDIGVGGCSDLYYAVYGGNYEIVKMLIDLGVDLEEDAYITVNPYYSAIEHHKHKIVELFLQSGASSELYFDGFTPLHFAVAENDISLAKILLEYNANVNAEIGERRRFIKDNYAITSMDIAKIENNEDMQELLMKFGGRESTREEKIGSLLGILINDPKYTDTMQKILRRIM